MGRIFSLIFSLFGVFITSAAGTWWFNTVAIGLFLRRLERETVVRQGSLKVCITILFVVWVTFSVLTAALVFLIFILLRSALSDWLAATLPKPLFDAGYVVVIMCIVLAVAAGTLAGLSEVVGAIGAAKRRRFLFNLASSNPPLPVI